MNKATHLLTQVDLSQRELLAGTTRRLRPSGRTMHSVFIGMDLAADYAPLTANDDLTTGGAARLVAVTANQKSVRAAQGPAPALDAGDYNSAP